MHLSRFERRKGTFVSAIVLCAILSYMHTGAVLASVSQTAVLFLFFLKFFFLTKLAQNRQKTCNVPPGTRFTPPKPEEKPDSGCRLRGIRKVRMPAIFGGIMHNSSRFW